MGDTLEDLLADDWLARTVHTLSRAAGPVFSAISWLLVIAACVSWYLTALPFIIQDQGWSITWIHLLFSHWIGLNIFWNLLQVTITPPGYAVKPAPERPTGSPQDPYRFCKKCCLVKPERAHHCSTCQKCVLKLDHHCPWLNCCIGHFNHRYFVLFMLYTIIGSIYEAIVSLPIYLAIQDGVLLGLFILLRFFRVSSPFHSYVVQARSGHKRKPVRR
eukprot:m.205378 g.205378  ORF g.205378 m.205378 type:complete len:217 (-) comp53876_c0_seq48:2247-2897(-)